MPTFETEMFSGSWQYEYRRGHSQGYEPGPLVKSGISVEATCARCGSGALTDVAMGTVELKCRACGRTEFVDKEKLMFG